jgi:hypothetical protein
MLAAPVEPAPRQLLDGLVQVLVEGEIEDDLRLARVVVKEPYLPRRGDRLVLKGVSGQTVELSCVRSVRTGALGNQTPQTAQLEAAVLLLEELDKLPQVLAREIGRAALYVGDDPLLPAAAASKDDGEADCRGEQRQAEDDARGELPIAERDPADDEDRERDAPSGQLSGLAQALDRQHRVIH